MQNNILDKDTSIALLKDNTTKKNLLFCATSYGVFGFKETDEIPLDAVYIESDVLTPIIKFRYEKVKYETKDRIKQKGEVFTPSWVCNAQNNLVDDEWFGKKNVFNRQNEETHTWLTKKSKITFPKDKTWEDYVKSTRLEITCGEAPYIVSRYDAVNGIEITIEKRIGLLDRKLRVISENTTTKEEWFLWVENAYKSIYAYDFQGDNVFLARKNLLLTFFEYYKHKFNEDVNTIPKTTTNNIMRIIIWNVFQMDGLRFVIPHSCSQHQGHSQSPSLFDDDFIYKVKKECEACKSKDFIKNAKKHLGKYVRIKDWEKNKTIKFVSLINNTEKKNG